MWRGPRTGSIALLLTLMTSGDIGAKTKRRSAALEIEATAAAANDSQSLSEAEPRPTAAVTHDPQILSTGEMLSLVKKYDADMADALVDGERHRETAVRKKDAIKLACIQDRLSNMTLMKKLADERRLATARSDIRADDLRLRHEFHGVELSYRRVVELRRELSECVGEDLEITGEPTNVPATPGDPTNIGATTTPERPTPASIYK